MRTVRWFVQRALRFAVDLNTVRSGGHHFGSHSHQPFGNARQRQCPTLQRLLGMSFFVTLHALDHCAGGQVGVRQPE